MARQLKTLIKSELEKRFKDVDGGVIVGYRGLNSEQICGLRKRLREKGARLHVIKNSLALRAFQTLGYEESKLTKVLDGPVGIVYSTNGTGAISAVKALYDWK